MAGLSGVALLCRSTLAGAYGGTVPLPLALCLGLRCSAAAVALASPAGTSGAVGGRVAALPLPAPWCGPGFVAAPPLALSAVVSVFVRGSGESFVSACGSMTMTSSRAVYLLEGVIFLPFSFLPASFPDENLDHVGRATMAYVASFSFLEALSWKLRWRRSSAILGELLLLHLPSLLFICIVQVAFGHRLLFAGECFATVPV